MPYAPVGARLLEPRFENLKRKLADAVFVTRGAPETRSSNRDKENPLMPFSIDFNQGFDLDSFLPPAISD